MRKFLIVLLIIAIALNTGGMVAFSADDIPVFRLQSLGIIGEYDGEHIVSRAEAVNSFVKIMIGNVFDMGPSEFKDVPSEHKYVNEINYAKKVGLVNGTSIDYFSPDEPIIGMHLVKMALITLGYEKVAEDAGGYEEGYLDIAIKKGILTGFGLDEMVTMSEFVIMLNKVLDTEVLELEYGKDTYSVSSQTLYEKILRRTELTKISEGIVTAVEISTLKGYKELRENEISIGDTIFTYYGEHSYDLLGKTVTVYYDDSETGEKLISNIMPTSKYNEFIIKNDNVHKLTKTVCEYYPNNKKKETINIDANASFIYNGINYIPESETINLLTGDIRVIDNDNDGVYDVVFIDEYESFVVDRVSLINESVFFKKNVTFRGATSYKFDFDDKDKVYFLYGEDNSDVSFNDITENSVITFKSSKDNRINYVTVINNPKNGVITAISQFDNEISIDDELYKVYKPNAGELFAEYKIGQEAIFYINDKDEIVDGQIGIDGDYGFVIAAAGNDAFGDNVSIKMVVPYKSQKVVELVGTEEVISYDYSNEIKLFELEPNVTYSMANQNGVILSTSRVSAGSINLDKLTRAIVNYKLNKEGKISKLVVYPLDYDWFKSSARYNFNGKLNSFGGLTTKDAFLVGDTTNVIFIPDVANPVLDDYLVDVTITNKTSQTAMAININEKTQIAECAILIATMRSQDVKPFTTTTKYSIVGDVMSEIVDDEVVYKLEVLTGKEINRPYIESSSNLSSVVAGLKCGDVIQYNTKSTGEIANVKRIAGMYEYKDIYSENIDNTVYGRVTDVQLNRLDDFLNEMVDDITLDLGAITKHYKAHREDEPVVYSYLRSKGEISISETDEISQGDELFLLVQENKVVAIVIFK